MSSSRKRIAVHQLQSEFHVSERRACRVLDQPRSSQRYESQPRSDEVPLTKRTLYIEPGSPWENGYAESFHSRLRDEFLAIKEVREPDCGPASEHAVAG